MSNFVINSRLVEREQMQNQLAKLIESALDQGVLWPEAFATFERLFIEAALRRCGGRIIEASDLIGIHRNTMTKKIADYSINISMMKR